MIIRRSLTLGSNVFPKSISLGQCSFAEDHAEYSREKLGTFDTLLELRVLLAELRERENEPRVLIHERVRTCAQVRTQQWGIEDRGCQNFGKC